MVAWRYEMSLLMLKNIFEYSKRKIVSHILYSRYMRLFS